MTGPRISLVTLIHNRPHAERLFVQGVIRSGCVLSFEAIIVRTQSPEKPVLTLPWLQVLDVPFRRNVVRALDAGCRAATGDYLFLVRPETVLRPGDMERLVSYADAFPDVGVLIPRSLNPDRSTQSRVRTRPRLWTGICLNTWIRHSPLGKREYARHTYAGMHADEPLDVDAVTGLPTLIRRSALDEVGSLDAHFSLPYALFDVCQRMRKQAWRVHYAPVADCLQYPGTDENAFGLRMRRGSGEIRSAVQYAWRHRYTP